MAVIDRYLLDTCDALSITPEPLIISAFNQHHNHNNTIEGKDKSLDAGDGTTNLDSLNLSENLLEIKQ